MVALRSLFFRVDLAWTIVNPCVISNRFLYFQRRCFYKGWKYNWNTDAVKDIRSVMDMKRKKTVTAVWRPVSTLSSSSYDENSNVLDEEVKTEIVSETEVVQCSISTSVSNVQHSSGEARLVDEPVDRSLRGKVPEAESMPSSKHSISIEAGASLMCFIKGKEGNTQKRIEEETGARLIFPSSKNEDSLIIEGISAESVIRASEKVQLIIDEAVRSPNLDYSHFVSLPLAIHPELVNKLVDFQNSILGTTDLNQCENLGTDTNIETSDEEDKDQILDKEPDVAVKLKAEEVNEHVQVNITEIPLVSYPPKVSKSSATELKSSSLSELGIDKSIFIKPKTFHLTVLMLKLWNKERVDAATEVLRSISSEVMDALESHPVSIRLKGLECMRGTFAKARVLYVPVEEIGGQDRLIRGCQVITDAFVKAGLVLEKDANQKLKLHATVMNARHRKRKKRTRNAYSFDARGIVDQYGTEEWGEYLVREAHLSQRFAFDENGYYHCCASIPFPEKSN